jgi:succinate dehydrogenase / fumarate reductase cytochrome b subunit
MPVLDMTLARDGKIWFLTSSVGRKLLMAITGLAFIGFITGHMVGNLTAYAGIWDNGEMMNDYAHFLKSFAHGAGIWVVRAGLAGLLFIHVVTALWLTWDNWVARPLGKGYSKQKLEANWGSRTMRYTACILCCFILYHLAHLTLGWLGWVPQPDSLGSNPSFIAGNAYYNFVAAFQNPIHSTIYIIVNLCLFLHIRHGIWSFTQTLGLSHPRYETVRKYGAILWALAVAGINISYPLAVCFGLLKLPSITQ